MTASNSNQSCLLETLEDRQLFSAMGTMNVIDAGVAPSMITSYTLNGVKDYADAGVSNWTRSATNPGTFAAGPKQGEKFGTFCLEPDQEFPSGAKVAYTVIDLNSDPTSGPMGATKADAIRELWGRFRSTIGTDGTKAAAFQIAVWEIVTDSGRNLSSGVFRAGAANPSEIAIKNQAQSWLNQINGTGPKANLLALSSPTDQDQVFELPTPVGCHEHPKCDDQHQPKKSGKGCRQQPQPECVAVTENNRPAQGRRNERHKHGCIR
ncbi:MAG: hypothetical protein JWN40_1075 [Phycisphaerales bacterium]|nr:hypothetical protein [Phycisphaerales bacterium]